MSWYSKMYKSHEVARERNRREQRRADFDRHGPSFIRKYHMSNLDHEMRMVQRELERIRRGVHKPPRHSVNNKANGSDVIKSFKTQDESTDVTPLKIDTSHSKEENKLYDAILFLQDNPSALVPIVAKHSESDAYLETLERVAPAFQQAEGSKPYMPRYIRDKGQLDKNEKSAMLEKYKFLLQRHSPEMRRNSPLLDTNRNSPLLSSRRQGRHAHARDTDHGSLSSTGAGSANDKASGTGGVNRDGDDNGGSLRLGAEFPDGETPEPGSSRTRKSRDLHELVNGGMDNARDNVNRRLTARDSDLPKRQNSVSDDGKQSGDNASKATKALFPGQDPDHYNADGSLRTEHTMPAFQERYDEAKKARWIRTREQRESERELSLNEIFAKEGK